MIAGEFAVLEPYQQLVVMAVDRFVYATITESKENQLTLANFDLEKIAWSYEYQNIRIDTTDQRVSFVKQAMLITCDYLYEQSIPLKPFTLDIKSELDDESGKKYGLGSSAAVVTAVITAVLTKHLDGPPAKELIFKLAAIAHVKTQGNGSGADIAASTYGGILQYTSFQAEWLLKKIEKANTVTELIREEWTYLSVESIHLPSDISIHVGWTGTPASTANLVDQILHLKVEQPQRFRQFIDDSTQAVNTFLQGVKQGDIPSLLKGIRENRQCLAMIGKHAHVEIETGLLSNLSDIAERLGGAGKLSGAGGGDCGIAFMPIEADKITQLHQQWITAGIQPLYLKVCPSGA